MRLEAKGIGPKERGSGGALENLCQSGSITHTQGLKDGISDRHRGDITTDT